MIISSQVMATLEVGPKSNLVVYEMMPEQPHKDHTHSAELPLSSTLNLTNASGHTTHHQNSYAITVYLWRTGKTLASISLGSPSLPSINPQVL